ncbi:MAG TPA: alpha/beta hydrolase [Bryobacteraceae bacterium]|nr:alpha/beta hydrolase [Bryobacteraceae bacterium]
MNPSSRFIDTNGIRMHYMEAGSGPLVVLLHGFPESWHSWRHQLPALAEAGFHAVAPDLRGYGRTDQPSAQEAYDIFQLTGDIVGLVNALGAESAVIFGHDWGAAIAAYLALFRPDLFRAVALLSVPYAPRGKVCPTQWEQQRYPGKIFYQAALRAPGTDAYLKSDIRMNLLKGLYALSGEAEGADRWSPVRDPSVHSAPAQVKMPSWLTEADLDFVEAEYRMAGFTGGLNYYRNMDRNWAMTPFLDGAKIIQPALFIAGDRDAVIDFLRPAWERLELNMPNLTKKVLLPGAGHWTQQEKPEEVNRLLIEFLQSLPKH